MVRDGVYRPETLAPLASPAIQVGPSSGVLGEKGELLKLAW